MNGACNSTLFWACPLESWEGVKRSNIIKFQLQSQFQRFLNQTLYVLSQIKDIKHIRDFLAFILVSCSISRTWRSWGGGGGVRMYLPLFLALSPGVKRSCIIKFQLQSQFQSFVCLHTNRRYKTYQIGFSECFVRKGSTLTTFFLVDEGREDPNTTLKVGHHWPSSKTPFNWRFAGWPMMAQH